jgi:glycosyltransferase involved in cell wall biosynthesis
VSGEIKSVGLAHDYLLVLRGAERVFGSISDCWPEAPIYTTVYSERGTDCRFAGRDVRTSALNRLPVRQSNFRALFPLYPRVVERFPVAEHDLLVSSSSAFAHGLRPAPGAVHICACHTPFRYIWSERENVLAAVPRPFRSVLARRLERYRNWDLKASRRVTQYIALSSLAKRRIEDHYGRDASLVLPGIDLARFRIGSPEDYFLFVGHLVHHKRADLALEAGRLAGLPVQVVGEGPELRALRRRYPEARFHGRVSDAELSDLYAGARALVMPQLEEFGLVSVEAQASGRPVLALRAGGALDTVVEGETGVLVEEAEPSAFAEAMGEVDFDAFDSRRIRAHAEQFSADGFRARFSSEVERLASL